jgi:F-type H+-transporting ATPase subunit b
MRRFRFLSCVLFAVCYLCVTSAACAQEESHSSAGPLDIRFDTAFWAVAVFVTLLLVLRAKAWGPILEGLQKREVTIRSSLEEAKKTRDEMEQMRLQFKKELGEAHQQIPKLMEDARKKADDMSAEMLAKASAQIQGDRERLRHEMEIAKDQALKELWEQTANLATLISAKAIGRSLNLDDHRRLMDESLKEISQAANN